MKLTLLGLPLGNIQDISLRAIEHLKNTKLVICEDTRVFGKLWQKLQHEGHLFHPFTGQLAVINEFNEKHQTDRIISLLHQIGEGTLVSDAGLPTISDPGYILIKKLIEQGGSLDIIPGPTAATTALAISGFSADKVLFLGFLPKKTAKRLINWNTIRNLGVGLTVIIYESPLRVPKTLQEIFQQLGNISVVIARELTKEHQQLIRGTATQLSTDPSIASLKGEVVILLRIDSK